MEPPLPDDRAIVAGITAGDRDAEEAFDARFRSRLLRFVQSRRILPQDQKDLVQDVLMAGFQKIRDAEFHGESSLGTWLVGILNHKMADYWKRCRRESDRLIVIESGPNTVAQSALDRIPDPAPHPDLAFELRETLEALPKQHRVVLLLNLTEGLTTDEIAAILKMRPGTVGRVLWEAKQLVRGKQITLKKLGPSGD